MAKSNKSREEFREDLNVYFTVIGIRPNEWRLVPRTRTYTRRSLFNARFAVCQTETYFYCVIIKVYCVQFFLLFFQLDLEDLDKKKNQKEMYAATLCGAVLLDNVSRAFQLKIHQNASLFKAKCGWEACS